MLSSPRELFNDLSFDARSAVSEVADYYCLQTAGSSEAELLTVLSQVRASFTCLARVTELSKHVRAELRHIAPHLLGSMAIADPLDEDSIAALVLPELALSVAFARLDESCDPFDGDHFEALGAPSRALPDSESFRRGDLVYVCDRRSEHFGRTCWFRSYTDPRLGHQARLTHIEFRRRKGRRGERRDSAEFRPEVLRFAQEPFGNEREGTHLRTFARDGFEVRVFDTGRTGRHGKVLLHYQLFDHRFDDGGEPIFEASDFFVSPLHAPDEDSTLASLLTFLSLQREDIEAGHFEGYTDRQLAWRDERAGDLALIASDLDEPAR